jgi:hypothetical protein
MNEIHSIQKRLREIRENLPRFAYHLKHQLQECEESMAKIADTVNALIALSQKQAAENATLQANQLDAADQAALTAAEAYLAAQQPVPPAGA